MHRYTRLLLASLTTTALLALAVSTASANRLSTSNQNIRATWTSLILRNTVNNNIVLCAVTLEGSFHSATITKTSGLLVGYITRASVASPGGCTGGTATVHSETLPWHIRYRGFTRELPNIRAIELGLIGVSFEIRESGGNTCTARTEALHPAIGNVNLNTTTHVAENLTPDPNARIPLTNGAGGIFCGLAEGSFSGESQTLTLLGNTTRITITLV